MSKLLLNEHPLIVLPSLAKALDSSDKAIILQQIHYWISDHRAPLHNGKRWHYASYAQWLEQFPWLSKITLGRHMRWLQEQGLIECEQPRTKEGDRTKWYTINYEKLESLEEGGITMTPPHGIKMTPWSYQNDTTHGIKMTPCLNEKRLREETKKETTTSDPPDSVAQAQAFVAVLKEGEKKKVCNGQFTYEYYDDELTNALGAIDISNARANALIAKHGRERIKEVIEMTQKNAKRNPGAYFNQALAHDWKPSKVTPTKDDVDHVVRATKMVEEEQKRKEEWDRGQKVKEALQSNPEALKSKMSELRKALRSKASEQS